MKQNIGSNVDYSSYVEIAEGIYWIGYVDDNAGLHCNPYLIVDGDEAVLIDAGSRTDFSSVMMKILQTGINPNHIERLIYHHYDPDLCGSVAHFEALIKNENLKILSHKENIVFINYYQSTRPKEYIEKQNYEYVFKSGRKLKFIMTPFSHSTGSFMTFDSKTGTLFSSDIFGSYSKHWTLFLEWLDHCKGCEKPKNCPMHSKPCPLHGIKIFHQSLMTSKKALSYALDQTEELDVKVVAPQHGSIILGADVAKVIDFIRSIEDIGIDWFLKYKNL